MLRMYPKCLMRQISSNAGGLPNSAPCGTEHMVGNSAGVQGRTCALCLSSIDIGEIECRPARQRPSSGLGGVVSMIACRRCALMRRPCAWVTDAREVFNTQGPYRFLGELREDTRGTMLSEEMLASGRLALRNCPIEEELCWDIDS